MLALMELLVPLFSPVLRLSSHILNVCPLPQVLPLKLKVNIQFLYMILTPILTVQSLSVPEVTPRKPTFSLVVNQCALV